MFFACRKFEIVHEASVATTSAPFMEHIKEEVEEDPMYDITEPQYSENIIQHLEIVPAVDAQFDKKEKPIKMQPYFQRTNKTTEPMRTAGILDLMKCDVCSKQFKQEKSLINHMGMKHNIECDFIKDQLYKCAYCSKQYANKNLLNKHLKCHGKNFPYSPHIESKFQSSIIFSTH